ncbi:AI-2E family transporter [Paenibacillus doosanensis]|uniref:AI-2E family transporter n=1 Tax=Paenibacillus doosanensis TaxID=1229154 RepID=UPI00217F632E|nr:AI-2E family transporter [Paenibacillus doosanensis]MCS7459350.1 AI-2E family transporter [Paenibacillus doosanensis]
MEFLKSLFAHVTVRRFSILFLIGLALFFLKGMLNLVLLTFLLTYIINSLQTYITSRLNRFFRLNYRVVVIIIYVFLIVLMSAGISNLWPKIIGQAKEVSEKIITLYYYPDDNIISQYVSYAIDSLDLQAYTKNGFGYLLKLSDWGKTLFLSVLFSLFFLLEKTRIMQFTSKFKTSKISWFYNEVEYFSKKFIVSFGKVIEAQFLIAILNTALTTIGLWLLGFPYLFALAIMVFVLSLIPVAGVIISLIPLCLIALQIGGLLMIAYVIIMIILIHLVESYFLNPRLMSSKTKLPMFYSFLVLIFSEHYLGIWGLIIGIPIFVFMLDILGVTTEPETDQTDASPK